MKTTRTIPTNWAFFNEHGMNYAAYGLIGLIGQILSGLSLAYAVYSLVLAKIGLTETPDVTHYMLLALAVLVAMFTELANRKLARPSIKPWVQKDKFADDPQARQRHEILTRSYRIILVLIAVLSYFLSGVGSANYAADSAPPLPLTSLDSIEQVYALREQAVQQSFAGDTALVAPVFKMRLAAAQSSFTNDSLALMKDRSKYQSCATEGNKWCKTKLTEYLGLIDRSRSALADSIAQISREENFVLQGFLKNREHKAGEQQKERTERLQEARAENERLQQEKEQDTNFQGLIFIILTVVGQTVFYLMIYLQLQIEAGSGIEHEIEPNEFWDKPGVQDEFSSTLAWRTERGLRRMLAWIFSEPDATKATVIPYWTLKRPEQENTTTHTKANPASCAVKGTRPKGENLADVKQRLKMYRKRLGAQEQKAIAQKKRNGKVDKRTQDAIDNNKQWVEHYLEVLKTLEKKPDALNGKEVGV